MPPQMRALLTSYSRSPTVAKWRSPRPVRLGTVKSIHGVRRNLAMTRPPAGVMHECALGYSGWFGVPASSGAHAGSATRGVVAVGVAGSDGGDRPPQRVGVLGVEAGDEGVGVGHRPHRVEPGRVDDVELVVEHEPAERAAGLLHGCFTPEPCGQRLLGGARGARGGADLLDLVVVVGPAPAVERWRPVRSELVGGAQAERIHQPEVRTDRRRRRRRQPHPRDRWVRRRVGRPGRGSRRRSAGRSTAWRRRHRLRRRRSRLGRRRWWPTTPRRRAR